MREVIVINGESWIAKSNALIECRTKMTALEQKIINVLASEIKLEDEDFKDYEFSIKEFAELAGTNETAIYNQIHDSARKLMQKVVTFRRGNETITTAFLSSAKTIGGAGKIILKFDPSLKPELLKLKKIFTQYKLKHVLAIQGTHSIRIYELLKQYEKIGKREFEVDELKELLGVRESYSRFYDFEKYVLKPTAKEINEKTDIIISYRKIKIGRKIAKLIFELIPKFVDEQKELANKLYSTEEILNIQKKCGLPKDLLNNMQTINLYEIACNKTIERGLDPHKYIELNYQYSLGKAKYLYSYLEKALNEDYANAIMCMSLLMRFQPSSESI